MHMFTQTKHLVYNNNNIDYNIMTVTVYYYDDWTLSLSIKVTR
uniref:Uncharacterized protein n=1 Tax=Amphimedon queenslandica TaxID=400682 RepID=A0A1X7UGM5_AMPQE